MTPQKTPIEALAEFLGAEPSEIDGSDEPSFTFGREEYLVLTDNQADAHAREYITNSAWAFTKSFLDSHSEAINELDEKSFRGLQEGCEGSNKAILKMIDDVDHFVSDAISSDGRGHFLSGYDGEENEEGDYFIYRIN